MATARFTGAEEDEPQFEDALGKETEDSQDWPQHGEEKSGASQQVKQVNNPSRQKEGQRYLPKKIHHHL